MAIIVKTILHSVQRLRAQKALSGDGSGNGSGKTHFLNQQQTEESFSY